MGIKDNWFLTICTIKLIFEDKLNRCKLEKI